VPVSDEWLDAFYFCVGGHHTSFSRQIVKKGDDDTYLTGRNHKASLKKQLISIQIEFLKTLRQVFENLVVDRTSAFRNMKPLLVMTAEKPTVPLEGPSLESYVMEEPM
jgi:hypothetical protein